MTACQTEKEFKEILRILFLNYGLLFKAGTIPRLLKDWKKHSRNKDVQHNFIVSILRNNEYWTSEDFYSAYGNYGKWNGADE